jgi:hypothetical protein
LANKGLNLAEELYKALLEANLLSVVILKILPLLVVEEFDLILSKRSRFRGSWATSSFKSNTLFGYYSSILRFILPNKGITHFLIVGNARLASYLV